MTGAPKGRLFAFRPGLAERSALPARPLADLSLPLTTGPEGARIETPDGVLHDLNPTAAVAWLLCDGSRDRAELAEAGAGGLGRNTGTNPHHGEEPSDETPGGGGGGGSASDPSTATNGGHFDEIGPGGRGFA